MCAEDTFSAAQNSNTCAPCPDGTTTSGQTGQTSPAACGKLLLTLWCPSAASFRKRSMVPNLVSSSSIFIFWCPPQSALQIFWCPPPKVTAHSQIFRDTCTLYPIEHHATFVKNETLGNEWIFSDQGLKIPQH